MKTRPPIPPGRTQSFVTAKGFEEINGEQLLVDQDGHARLLLELSTDPDHPQSDPAAAYGQILGGMQPGLSIRLLSISWPAPDARQSFLRQLDRWPRKPENVLLATLHDSMQTFLNKTPLPFHRRTIMEVVLASREAREWAEAAAGMLENYGISVRKLAASEVQELARWLCNPRLE